MKESKSKTGKGQAAGSVESTAADEFVLDLPAAEDAPAGGSKSRKEDALTPPKVVLGPRLGEMIQGVLQYALDQNVRPALDRMAEDFEARIERARDQMLADARAQLDTYFDSFKARLDIRAVDVINENEQALKKSSGESVEGLRRQLELEQQEAAQKFSDAIRVRLMQMVVAEEDRLRTEAADTVKKSLAGAQEGLLMEMARFTEQARTRGDEMAAQALKQVKHSEQELSERLKRFEEIGTRLTTQLEERSAKVLADADTRLNRQSEDSTARVHQSFMRHIVTELSGKQARFVEEAMKPLEEAAEQNLKRMRRELARMVKEVGQRFVVGVDDVEKD